MKAGPAESREHLSVRNNHFRVVTPYAPSLPGTSGMQRSDPDFWREQRENEAEAAKTKDRAK